MTFIYVSGYGISQKLYGMTFRITFGFNCAIPSKARSEKMQKSVFDLGGKSNIRSARKLLFLPMRKIFLCYIFVYAHTSEISLIQYPFSIISLPTVTFSTYSQQQGKSHAPILSRRNINTVKKCIFHFVHVYIYIL